MTWSVRYAVVNGTSVRWVEMEAFAVVCGKVRGRLGHDVRQASRRHPTCNTRWPWAVHIYYNMF
jgi:hypothetical protein